MDSITDTDVASRALERLELQREDAEKDVVARQAQAEAAASEEAAPRNAMLDPISAFRAAVKQRVDEAAPYGVRDLNAHLRELFVGFRLGLEEDEPFIQPILRLDVLNAILAHNELVEFAPIESTLDERLV